MRISRRRILRPCAALVLAVGCFAMASPQAAPPEGKGRNKQHAPRPEQGDSALTASALITAGITVSAAQRLADDAGAGGFKPLPPGIRKNLARGKPLPPGIAKKSAPPAMLGRLPPHPGYEWQVAGTDLVLVQIGTAIIADVLRDVFR